MNILYLSAAAGVVLLLLIIVFLPRWQARKAGVIDSDKWKAENEFRKTLIQVIGGILIICGLFFTWEELNQFHISQENMKSGQISSRYSNAIQLLSKKEETTTRIGAIYALEQIVKEDPNYKNIVLNVLSALVRNTGYLNEEEKVISPDVQSALDVIFRLRKRAHGEEESLSQIHLAGAKLACANLAGKDLRNVDFYRADLYEANLENANLKEAQLKQANLYRVNLGGSVMQGANLEGADMRNANLDGADLSRANLAFVNLEGASLHFTNLEFTQELKVEQLLETRTLNKVRGLDSEIMNSIKQARPELFKEPGE